ncbi:MAG: pacearchaeosortase [Nanoarchaeota archaeon]|nr:pacearchaeosortase [Nanoarchaeota archaeon]
MKKNLLSILIRYLILIITGTPNFWLFYFLFTPLTVYVSYFFLKLFYENTLLMGNIILVNSIPIEIIEACVAGSAYYLMLIFNLSIPSIKIKKRLLLLLFSFLLFFIVNIIRIIVSSALFISGAVWFDFAHLLFWYIGSIVFVVGIWFFSMKLFKIKEIPFYTDVKYIFSLAKKKP